MLNLILPFYLTSIQILNSDMFRFDLKKKN